MPKILLGQQNIWMSGYIYYSKIVTYIGRRVGMVRLSCMFAQMNTPRKNQYIWCSFVVYSIWSIVPYIFIIYITRLAVLQFCNNRFMHRTYKFLLVIVFGLYMGVLINIVIYYILFTCKFIYGHTTLRIRSIDTNGGKKVWIFIILDRLTFEARSGQKYMFRMLLYTHNRYTIWEFPKYIASF